MTASIDWVRLPYDDPDSYDTDFYRNQLIRATESILSPLGWDRTDIKTRLSDTTTHNLRNYLEATP